MGLKSGYDLMDTQGRKELDTLDMTILDMLICGDSLGLKCSGHTEPTKRASTLDSGTTLPLNTP
jgi:hypothetical protein